MALFRKLPVESIPGSVFLHSMPGRTEDIDIAFEQMKKYSIDVIVAIAEWHEIKEKSPEYYRAIKAHTVPVAQLVVVPIPDFSVPETGEEIAAFRDAIEKSYTSLQQQNNILIHCAAGIGRTGTFASALLMRCGIGIDEAVKQVESTGSQAQTSGQLMFLEMIADDLLPE